MNLSCAIKALEILRYAQGESEKEIQELEKELQKAKKELEMMLGSAISSKKGCQHRFWHP